MKISVAIDNVGLTHTWDQDTELEADLPAVAGDMIRRLMGAHAAPYRETRAAIADPENPLAQTWDDLPSQQLAKTMDLKLVADIVRSLGAEGTLIRGDAIADLPGFMAVAAIRLANERHKLMPEPPGGYHR